MGNSLIPSLTSLLVILPYHRYRQKTELLQHSPTHLQHRQRSNIPLREAIVYPEPQERSRNSRYLARLDRQVRLRTLDNISRVDLSRRPVRVLVPGLVTAERDVAGARGLEEDAAEC